MKALFAIVVTLTLAFSMFAFVPMAYAADPPAAPASGGALDRLQQVGRAANLDQGTEETSLARIIGSIITAASSLLGVIFVAQMVYAGWLWMTSRDETDQFDKAKHIIRRSIVGLAIVLGAWGISIFVISQLYLAAQ